jgi:hypothetical protein
MTSQNDIQTNSEGFKNNGPSPFRAINSCLQTPVQLYVFEFNPEKVQPMISVQPNWNGSRGIIRGVIEDGCLIEDHITEELDENGRLVDAGRRISGADNMRRPGQVWTVEEHLENYRAGHPCERVLAWTGNGNLLSNPYFVAWLSGQLFHLRGEERRFAAMRYSCLAVRQAGQKCRVSIETFDLSKPLPDGLMCFTVGQRLVEGGKPIDTDGLVRLAEEQQFYDLRHLFLFGRIPRGEKRWIDAGLAAFWNNGEMDTAAVEGAIRGEPVTVDVSQFGEQEVRDAMGAKDYVEVGEPKQPGQYSLGNGALKVVLLEGLYPHNMIGIRKDGTLFTAVVRGLSNRAGVTIRGAAQLMRSLGAADALLIDNGGDVMLSFDGEMVSGSAEGERNKLRSILLFRCQDDVFLERDDARLITYPQQVCASLIS